jgi:ribose-phosphate pyrophosphokinase
MSDTETRAEPLLFALPGKEDASTRLASALGAEVGTVLFGRFPDGETHLRIDSACTGRACAILAGLDRPDEKVVPLAFLAGTLRELGASRVVLIAPYLSYLRQDQAFHPGECVSALRFASLLSSLVDVVVTVDPHLHRLRSLGEAFPIPALAVSSAPATAAWIAREVRDPLVVGPDEESRKVISDVARRAGAPFIVLQKQRRGDRDVDVSFPDLRLHRGRTPVVVDDVISTGITLGTVVRGMAERGFAPPVCVATHAVFASGALEAIEKAGARRIVTTNTVTHATNAIDVDPLLVEAVRSGMRS